MRSARSLRFRTIAGVPAEHAAAMFFDIADLAQQAVESGLGMYLWQREYT